MTVFRVFPQVAQVDLNLPGLMCPLQDAVIKWTLKEPREDGDDLKLHPVFSCKKRLRPMVHD